MARLEVGPLPILVAPASRRLSRAHLSLASSCSPAVWARRPRESRRDGGATTCSSPLALNLVRRRWAEPAGAYAPQNRETPMQRPRAPSDSDSEILHR